MADLHDSEFLDDPEFQSLLVGFLELLERGETIDRIALGNDFPKYADEIGRFLDDREMLRSVATSFDSAGRSRVAVEAFAKTMDSLSFQQESSPEKPFHDIGEYEIRGEIARGGMGVVYRARQRSLQRDVALKMILTGRLAGESDVQRFQQEARAAGRLKHPHIVPVHEIGEHEGHHYFTMDLIEGHSLADEIIEAPLSPERAASLIAKVAGAVHFAHQQGTIHRDLKPANVLVSDDGNPHVTDFGLARVNAADDAETITELTSTGQILGTPSYMSPEQASGRTKSVGVPSDIFSLGAMLYACLTGRAPFAAGSTAETLMQVIQSNPISPKLLNASVPKDLATICLKCMRKEPFRRYRSAQELADDLDRWTRGEAILARPIGVSTRLVKWSRRRPALATTLALVLVTTTTLLLVWSSMTIRLKRHRDFAIEQYQRRHLELVHARIQEARATRLAGQRSESLAAIRQVPRRRDFPSEFASVLGGLPSENDNQFAMPFEQDQRLQAELRREAIQTLVSPGFELVREIPFGEVYRVRVSDDGNYLAACGEYSFGKQSAANWNDRRGPFRTSLVVWNLETGKQIAEKLISPRGDAQREYWPWSQAVERVSRYERFTFLPGSDLLLTYVQDELDDREKIVLWNPLTDQTTRVFDSKELCVSNDGTLLFTKRDDKWEIEKASDGSILGHVDQGPVYGMQESGQVVHTQGLRFTNILKGKESTKRPPARSAWLVGPNLDFVIAKHRSAGSDEIEIQRLSDGTAITQLPGANTAGNENLVSPLDFCFSPGGKWLAYTNATMPLTVGIWSLHSNQISALLPGAVAYHRMESISKPRISFSPDDRMLALYLRPNDQTMQIWDLEKRRTISKLDCFDPIWSDDGRWLIGQFDPGKALPDEPDALASTYTGRHGRVIRIWRVSNPLPRMVADGPVNYLDFDRSGQQIIINSFRFRFRTEKFGSEIQDKKPVLDDGSGYIQQRAIRFDDRDQVWHFAFPTSPFRNQKYLYLPPNSIRPIELRMPEFSESEMNLPLVRSPQSKVRYISDLILDPQLLRFSDRTQRLAIAVQLHWRQEANNVGSRMSENELAILRFDLGRQAEDVSNQAQDAHEWGLGVRCMAISAEGDWIATGTRRYLKVRNWIDGHIAIQVDLAKLKPDHERNSLNPPEFRCAVFSPDSRQVICGTTDGQIVLADLKTQRVLTHQTDASVVSSLTVHPHRRLLVSGGGDGRIFLWTIDQNGRHTKKLVPLADWVAHSDTVTALAFHPGGSTLVSGAADGETIAWNLDRLRGDLRTLDLQWDRSPANAASSTHADTGSGELAAKNQATGSQDEN